MISPDSPSPSSPSSPPDAATLQTIQEYLLESRFMSAWRLAQAWAPLQDWPWGEARHLASRLARELGSSRLAAIWNLINYRRFPEDESICLSGVFCQISRRGPLEALTLVEARLARSTSVEARTDWLALKAFLLGRLQDFRPAHRAANEAIDLAPTSYWPKVQRSQVLEMEDRYAEALDEARAALALAPHRSVAVLQTVDCLIHLGRDDEAVALLEGEAQREESPIFAGRLVLIYSEREDTGNALRCLEAHDRLSPLIDDANRDWSHRRRADMLYLAGDFEGFLKYADLTEERAKGKPTYHKRVAAHMREPDALTRSRKRLAVPFVRQHNMTCAPATLAALAAYWGKDYDHLAIAEAICHDGTPWHKERQWAESHGFIATEFRLTHDILVALIDRGVPFTLSTEAVTSAHLQACIGYDDRQGIALLRDPTERHYGEVILEGLIEDHPVQGPRGMLVLPETESARIEGLVFPDAEVFGAFHRLLVALDTHDRQAARATVDTMPPGHPMSLWAEYRLAGYDRNPVAEFHAIDSLVKRFPENAPLRFGHLGALYRIQDVARQKEVLTAEFGRPFFDPVYYSEMGEYLARDFRQLDLADYYLRKAIRRRPSTARVYASMAWCRWKEYRFADSARYRRVASCMNPGWEGYAAAYAEACRVAGKPEEGLIFLRERVETTGHKSAGPWQTLAEELVAQGRTPEAMIVLDRGLTSRPLDGELMLAAGRLFTGWGEREKGEALLRQARGKVRDAEWHRDMAQNEVFFGNRPLAMEHWREVLLLEPYSVEAHRALARLLAEENGAEAAITFLVAATEEHSHIPSLWTLRAEWEQTRGPARAIPSLRAALKLDPDFAYALRELAIQLEKIGEKEAALAVAREALEKEPAAPTSSGIVGSILEELDRKDEARAFFEASVRRDVDYLFGSRSLLRIAPDAGTRREVLDFIKGEMRRQVSDGSIIPEYKALAFQYLEPAVLLGHLREFCEERPDLWQTWQARREQAVDMDLLEEALLCAGELIARFPIMPRAWVEMALTDEAMGNYEKEIEMLGKAVNLSPSWGWAARLLSEALERLGRYDEALTVLERNLQYEPLAGESYGYLADLLWKRGQQQPAFDRLLAGMRHCPSYSWGWSRLAEWSLILHREDEVVQVMEMHLPSREHLPEWWASASDIFSDLQRPASALELIEKGLLRHPDEVDLFEKKAAFQSELELYEESLATCADAVERFPDSRSIRGRQASVLMAAGQPNEAIRQMTLLTTEFPNYLWAIRQLATWLGDRQRWAELQILAQQWIRHSPQASMAYGFLGQAEKGLSHRAEAKKALGRAFALDPAYAYAGRNLLTYQIEDKEFEAAETTLKNLEHYVSPTESIGDAIELALARKNLEQAKSKASEMLHLPDANSELLQWVGRQFATAGLTRDWQKLLDAAALAEKPLPSVLDAWIRSLAERGKTRKAPRRLKKLRAAAHEDLAAAGWITLLDVVDKKKYLWKVGRWIRRHRVWFCSRNDLWSAVGSALVNAHQYRAAKKWFADWQQRGAGVECFALFDYGVALQEVDGWETSMPIREVALARFPHHSLAPALRSLMALFQALKGEMAAARKLGAEVESGKLTETHRAYFSLYQSLENAAQGDLATSEAHYREAVKIMNLFLRNRSIGRLFQDATDELAKKVPFANEKASKIKRKWGRYRGVRPQRNIALWILIGWVIVYLISRIFAG